MEDKYNQVDLGILEERSKKNKEDLKILRIATIVVLILEIGVQNS